MTILGGIEAGGSKFVCAVGNTAGEVLAETTLKTTTPEETLAQVVAFFEPYRARLTAVGMGCFGPLDTKRHSATFGCLTHTPKVAWQHFPIIHELKKRLHVPIGFDTDVNSAALGEYYFGAGKGFTNFLYVTVGTGIGAALMVKGEILSGLDHPEMGHIFIPVAKDDTFAGICHYHHRCFEGLASGEAIKKRWQVKSALDLPQSHAAWQLEAHYLALGFFSYACVVFPERFIVGGGVMKQTHLYALVRERIVALNQRYLPLPENMDLYIVPPGLQNRSGVMGALLLGQLALEKRGLWL